MNGSEWSLNTIVANSANEYPAIHTYPTLTPNMARKFNPLAIARDTLTR
jgi:hypothetical protein